MWSFVVLFVSCVCVCDLFLVDRLASPLASALTTNLFYFLLFLCSDLLAFVPLRISSVSLSCTSLTDFFPLTPQPTPSPRL